MDSNASDTPRLSASSIKTPTNSVPHTPRSDRSPLKRHIDAWEEKIGLPSFDPHSPLHSSDTEQSASSKRTYKSNKRMRKISPPSDYCGPIWSPEMHFAMRAAGRTSYPYLTIKDMMEGKDVLTSALSQLPKGLFQKVYISKRATRDCVLGRMSSNLRELDALEKSKDVILEMQKLDENQLAAIDKNLGLFKEEADACGDALDDEIAFRHAVYANEFRALASTNTQLHLMLGLSDSEATSDESDSGTSTEVPDRSSVSDGSEDERVLHEL